ncbi:hypothetical protein HON52_03940 [Candidatus Uhrbacteria bacterium]|jgi:hypothetical protein|nr:hypothetical protein [Candidatus Uhrbacteria bacterium]
MKYLAIVILIGSAGCNIPHETYLDVANDDIVENSTFEVMASDLPDDFYEITYDDIGAIVHLDSDCVLSADDAIETAQINENNFIGVSSWFASSFKTLNEDQIFYKADFIRTDSAYHEESLVRRSFIKCSFADIGQGRSVDTYLNYSREVDNVMIGTLHDDITVQNVRVLTEMIQAYFVAADGDNREVLTENVFEDEYFISISFKKYDLEDVRSEEWGSGNKACYYLSYINSEFTVDKYSGAVWLSQASDEVVALDCLKNPTTTN